MSFKLKCPACQDAVIAEETDRGSYIKCGTCWTEVPVPAGTTPAVAQAVPLPAQKAPSGVTTPAMGKALPATAVPAVAKALPATPVVAKAMPVMAKPMVAQAVPVVASPKPARKRADDDDESPKSRGRKRASDDDDDDDNGKPARRRITDADDEKKGCSGAIMIVVLLGLMFVMVAGAGGLIWYAMKSDTPEVVEGTPNTSSNTTTPENPVPVVTQPMNWEKLPADGFSIELPMESRTTGPISVTYGTKLVRGMWYLGKENNPQVTADAKFYNLQSTQKVQLHRLLELAYSLKFPPNFKTETRTVSNRPCLVYIMELDGLSHTFLATQIGDRAFTFHFACPQNRTPDIDVREQKFFASIELSYPGDSPVVVGPGGVDPIPVKPPFDEAWKPIQDIAGITIDGPLNINKNKNTIEHDGKFYANQSWNATHLGYDYMIFATDFPPENAPEINRLFPILVRNSSLVSGPIASKADGKPAEDWKLQGIGNTPMMTRTVKVGFRTYTMIVGRHFTHRDDEAELPKRFEKFLSSVKIAFDPAAKDFDPLKDANWATLPKTNGFTVVGPKGVREEIAQIGFGFKDAVLKGVRYTSEDDVVQLQISIFPITPTWDYKRITTELFRREKIVDGPKDVKLDTANAEDRTFEDFIKNPITIRTAQVGNSVVGVRIARKARQPEKDYFDRHARILNTFKLGNGGGTTTPGLPGVPTVGQKGDLEFAANIAPFWAGASIPSQNAFLAFGTREGAGKNRAGTVRRYSYPDFKLQATYHLPQPVSIAVVDEKANKLYCAAVTKDNPALNIREKAFLPSVVHVYDLKPILDGGLKELADIKPLTVFGINGNIGGMELAPDGSTLYVGVQTPPASPRGNYTGRIYRFDCDKLKANG